MYGNRFWYRAPFFFVPAAIFWCGLEMLFDHLEIVQKISEKRPNKQGTIRKLLHVVCACVGHILSAIILLTIEALTGIDLLNVGVD